MTKHIPDTKEMHRPPHLNTAAIVNDFVKYFANKMMGIRPAFPDCRDVFYQSDAVVFSDSNQLEKFVILSGEEIRVVIRKSSKKYLGLHPMCLSIAWTHQYSNLF